MRSPVADLVNKVFINERPLNMASWSKEEDVTWEDYMKCTTFAATAEGNLETGTNAYLTFAYPNQVFGKDNVCCSPCFKSCFLVDLEDAVALGEHYRRAREASHLIGYPIKMDLKHDEDWPDDAIGKSWLAAAEDIETFISWVANDSLLFFIRADEDRKNRIIHGVLDMHGCP